MGMIGKFVALPAERFSVLRTDRQALDDYLYPESGDYPDEVHPECDFLYVEKAWHGMHFVLTGTAWGTKPPLGLAVLGGKKCGRDTGYGRPRYLDVNQVREVARALEGLSVEEAIGKYTPEDLEEAEIYPRNWGERGADRLGWVAECLGYLVAFYRDAAAQGKVVIKYID
jgi:hypothetical protein